MKITTKIQGKRLVKRVLSTEIRKALIKGLKSLKNLALTISSVNFSWIRDLKLLKVNENYNMIKHFRKIEGELSLSLSLSIPGLFFGVSTPHEYQIRNQNPDHNDMLASQQVLALQMKLQTEPPRHSASICRLMMTFLEI
jgi:hypothetical protein